MAFFKIDTSEENVKDYSGDGGKWLNKSGIYDVIIKAVIVDTTAKGSEYLNLWIEYEGQLQPLYQAMRLTNNDGSVTLVRNYSLSSASLLVVKVVVKSMTLFPV